MAGTLTGLRIVLRNDTAANWTLKNPVLLAGEMGIERETKKKKIGNGITPWNSLPYDASNQVVVENEDPTTTDVDYEVGTIWINVAGTYPRVHVLGKINAGAAQWMLLVTPDMLSGMGLGDMMKAEYGGSSDGVVKSADKLETPRSIGIGGSYLTGTANFDGTQNITITINPTGAFSDAMDGWNDAVADRHTHSNKTILDAITAAFTTAEKTKLSNLADIRTIGNNLVLNPNGELSAIDTVYEVATPTADGLMSSSDKSKLNGIAAGAQANLIERILVNDEELIPLSKAVNISVPETPADIGAAPASHTQAISTIIGLVDALAEKLNLIGGTMTGKLHLRDNSSEEFENSEAVNKAYVDARIGSSAGMTYKGTIGVGGTVTVLPTTGVKVGDMYRVITAGTYGGHAAQVGDSIIAQQITPSIVWDLIPSGNEGQVEAGANLVGNQLIIGDSGTNTIKTLPAGANNTILKILAGIPTWAADTSLQGVKIDTTDLIPSNGVVTIPIATNAALGVVKGSVAANGVSINASGTMDVNSLNVEKLFVEEGDTWILDCGGA